MDYMREAVEYLKNYDKLNIALNNLQDEIRELKIDIKSVSGMEYSDLPKGAGINTDDRIINLMFRLDKAQEEYKSTSRTLNRMNKVFDSFEKIDNNYAKILKKYFIENLTEAQIADDLKISDRHLRRLKQQAIKAFSVTIFGISAMS